MDRQDIQTRRAENQVWNGSGAYDTKPELLVFDGGGDADLYGNTVLGLAGRYYRFDLFRPLLNDFHRSVQEGLYTDVFFLVLEGAVFRRGAQERPILPALRAAYARTLLREKEPLELMDGALIPALDAVGAKYENGTLFLPQLLQAASAAQSAFDEVKTAMAAKGGEGAGKGRIVLATVHGDVHDIGKNIVKVILENYGFEVIDLGRDVPVEAVVDAVRDKDVHLVGLSALMTTTLKSMEETIAALRQAQLPCKIMAGGAVLTPEYAKKIGADYYAKDAKQSADIAKSFFSVG